MRSPVVIVAALAAWVATIAFVSYTRTLLPGVDLGDTGAFQAAVLWPEVSARQAYPLYYSLAAPFVRAVASTNPARGLNLFSALCASLAVGLLAGVTAQVSGSLVGGAVAGLLLAFSYTFWTQAVIAEVYSLHLALVGLCLVSLTAYAQRPTLARLAVFFAVYAVSFGNHLSMILLFVPFVVFLFMVVEKPRSLLQPAVIMSAVAIACAGALQYLPSLLAIWTAADAPARWTERLAAFWFDVTKADWRESMVLGISPADIPARLRMFAFDARQQFGTAGVLMAIGGAVALWRTSRPWAALVVLAYVVNTAFAFSYNVGDPHVFFLPGHYFAALAAGCFVASAARGSRLRQAAVIVAGLFLVAWRGYDTWPAADRHDDWRATQLVERMTFGLDDNRALLVTAVNWQIENALLYESRYGNARRVAWTRLSDVFLHFPLLVADNHATSRDVVLTSRAAAEVTGAFGSLLPVVPDPIPPTPTLVSTAARVPRGAPYVLVVLPPPSDEVLDSEMLGEAIASLAGGPRVLRGKGPYQVIVGTAGDRPLYHRSATEPFRERVALPEGVLDIRMDSWVPLETFRRGGFGHVVLGRDHLMTIERGVSLVWLDRERKAEPFYAVGLYAPRPRFRLPSAALPQHALLH